MSETWLLLPNSFFTKRQRRLNMEVFKCPLENNLPVGNRNEARAGIFQTINKVRHWYCINPSHPTMINGAEEVTKCIDRECYYLRKVL